MRRMKHDKVMLGWIAFGELLSPRMELCLANVTCVEHIYSKNEALFSGSSFLFSV